VDDDEEAVGDCADADRDARVFCTRTLWSQEREWGVGGGAESGWGSGGAERALIHAWHC
jgi:hypothetical protein